jgi:hypothetical protein
MRSFLDRLYTASGVLAALCLAGIAVVMLAQAAMREPGLLLRVQELATGPTPFPLRSGFSPDTAYRALGLYNPAESSDAYFILSNDRDEIWFISNRHLRTAGCNGGEKRFRLPLQDMSGVNS